MVGGVEGSWWRGEEGSQGGKSRTLLLTLHSVAFCHMPPHAHRMPNPSLIAVAVTDHRHHCSHSHTLLSLPPPIDMWDKSLEVCSADQKTRRIQARAASNTTSKSRNAPSPNKTPRKKSRSSGYLSARLYPLDIPALQHNYDNPLFSAPPQVADRPAMLLQQ